VLREGVRRVVERLAVDARLRVLEIGAGTGGTTAYVLPALPADRVEEYVFTDISRRFLSAAKEKFAEYPFVRFEVLDIERSPAEQGLRIKFDMVVCLQRPARDQALSPTTVRHASQLRQPEGCCGCWKTRPVEGVDLIWGLTDGAALDDPWRHAAATDTDGRLPGA
jgi:SAM-dependent methyltransferase